MTIYEQLLEAVKDNTWYNSTWLSSTGLTLSWQSKDESSYPYYFSAGNRGYWTNCEGYCVDPHFVIVKRLIPEHKNAPLEGETLILPEMPYQEETVAANKQMIENLWAYVSKCQLEVEKSLKLLEDLDQKVQVHHCRLSIAKVLLTHATEPGSADSPRYNYQRPEGPDVLPDGWSRDG